MINIRCPSKFSRTFLRVIYCVLVKSMREATMRRKERVEQETMRTWEVDPKLLVYLVLLFLSIKGRPKCSSRVPYVFLLCKDLQPKQSSQPRKRRFHPFGVGVFRADRYHHAGHEGDWGINQFLFTTHWYRF